MKQEYERLPLRDNVSLIVFSGKKFLLVNLLDWEEDWWKFPQGGVEKGETLLEAGKRELKEEIGTDKINIVGQSKYTNSYVWPDELITKKQNNYRGQSQRFLVFEFLGKSNDIMLGANEVRKYRWVTKKHILEFSADREHMFFKNYNRLIPKILGEFLL